MEKIELPKFIEEKIAENHSRFTIEPLYPGYGATIGNPLRRALLSSIVGAAATSFKIEGTSHEFSSIPHAKEDVIEVMMNLKDVHFKCFSDEPVVLELSKKGPSVVTAADFKKNSNIEITNPEAPIITLDKSANLEMEVVIEKGRGFKSAAVGTEDKTEIGRIAIDSFFSPVERVSLKVEDTRVGQMTNYDKLTLDVVTNGTIEPEAAIKEAAEALVSHYRAIISPEVEKIETAEVVESDAADDEIVTPVTGELDSKSKVEELGLSSRTANALVNAGIKTYGGLKRLSALKVEEIKGMGKKGVDEINALLGR